jgi:hypothetical protein
VKKEFLVATALYAATGKLQAHIGMLTILLFVFFPVASSENSPVFMFVVAGSGHS